MPDNGEEKEIAINHLIGNRLRTARKDKHIPLKDIANCIHISPQQLAKYEDGSNRISAVKLFVICMEYNIDINYFIYNINDLYKDSISNVIPHYNTDLTKVIDYFQKIKDNRIRKSILTLLENINKD